MHRGPRKTTPRVKDGRVQRKHHRDVDIGPDAPFAVVTRVPGSGYRHVLTEDELRRFFAVIPGWTELSRGLRAVILDEADDEAEGWYQGGVIGLTAWPDPPAITVSPWHFAAHQAVWERLGIRWRAAPEFVTSVAATDEPAMLTAAKQAIQRCFRDGEWAIERDEARVDTWAAVDVSEPGTPKICELVRVDESLHIYERCARVLFDRRTAANYLLLHVFLHELGHHVDAALLSRKGRRHRGEEYAEGWALRHADAIWEAWLGRCVAGAGAP